MERWDLYYKDETLSDILHKRGDPIPEGLYHLVVGILVRHSDGDYLLMKRDEHKVNHGGYYEATAGGCALTGEDKFACAKRELFEETGISSDNFIEIDKRMTHDAILYYFVTITDCDKSSIVLQSGETSSYKWISEEEFIEFVNSDQMIDGQKKRCYQYFVEKGYIKE